MKILFLVIAATVVCGLIFTIYDDQSKLAPPAASLQGVKASFSIPPRPISQKQPNPQAIDRSHAFEKLKAHWIALPPDDPKAEAALIKESVDLLFCTAEFVMLSDFLKSQSKGNVFIEIEFRSEELFSSEKPHEARAALLRMVKELRDFGVPSNVNKTELNSQIELWCFEAGKNCPPAEFQSFCDALDDADFIQQATFGRDLARVTTDPKGAVASTMALLQHDITTIQSHQFLSILLTNLPGGSNYAAFEQMLPPDQGNYRYDLKGARAALLSEWAAHDITAAANYVVAHPERIVPENMESVVTGYIVKDMAAGLEWIQTFPEGPWFDHAARVASNWIAEIHPNEARELALQIQDKDIRKECVRNAEHYLSLQKK